MNPDASTGRRFATHIEQRWYARDRRASLKARGLCINGAKHGKATNGCRCLACYETHKESR